MCESMIYQYFKRKIQFLLFGIQCGKGLRVRGKIKLSWKVNLRIGDNVIINSGNYHNPNPIGGEVITSFTTVFGGKIRIGNNVGISNATIFSRNSIVIEDNVMIGGGTKIYDTDFHPLDYEKRVNNLEEAVQCEPVRICEGAFIGTGVIIMKGVTIGRHSVVGAGAVVTKSIPDNEMWAGNPAHFIKGV